MRGRHICNIRHLLPFLTHQLIPYRRFRDLGKSPCPVHILTTYYKTFGEGAVTVGQIAEIDIYQDAHENLFEIWLQIGF